MFPFFKIIGIIFKICLKGSFLKKIYIAGFDVFMQNSIEIGKNYVELCKKYGFEGLYPLDNVVDFNQEKN